MTHASSSLRSSRRRLAIAAAVCVAITALIALTEHAPASAAHVSRTVAPGPDAAAPAAADPAGAPTTLASARGKSGGSSKKGKGSRFPRRPNIVFFLTDDQTLSTVRPDVMPRLFRSVIANGTTFSDYIVPDAAVLPIAGGDGDRPVRPQQRRPRERLRRPAEQEETCSRPGCSGPVTRRPTSASSTTATSAR